MPDRYLIRPLGTWTDPVTASRRGAHLFRSGWDATLDLLDREIEHLDGKHPVVVQVDVQQADIRADGMLKARARVGFPGVVVSFTSRFGPLRYASDAYEQQYSFGMAGWQANVRAIALALESLRAVDRYGVTRRGEQYQGWTALPASRAGGSVLFQEPDDAAAWMIAVSRELGDDSSMPPKARYKWLTRRLHPDAEGGNAELWERLDAAASLLKLRSTDA